MVFAFTVTHTTIMFGNAVRKCNLGYVGPSELELHCYSCHTVTEVRFSVVVKMLKYSVSFCSSC